MLSAVPKSRFSWDFWLQCATGETVGEIQLSFWRPRSSVKLASATYRVRREGLLGPFILEAPDGTPAATAVKPSAFHREFAVSHGALRYVLRAKRAFRRECGLFLENQSVGSIIPKAWFGRQARVELTDEVPLLVQAFVVWLALRLWQGGSKAAIAAAAANS